jgi:hypothetical protein
VTAVLLDHVRAVLDELADDQYQSRVWTGKDPAGEMSSFVECVERLFDDSGLDDALDAPTKKDGQWIRYLSYSDSAFRSQGMLPPAHPSDPDAVVEILSWAWPLGGPEKAGVLAGRGLIRKLLSVLRGRGQNGRGRRI